ncbi:unnamed protein product [Owenia fusiformis]|uniref:Uncharacterized protein n=1 Tax=Owenia fusiformis TaxID=6347 RepID=A0A8J1UM77_OWEFU|nr:unnamed protein product [Owenia fusiformis]
MRYILASTCASKFKHLHYKSEAKKSQISEARVALIGMYWSAHLRLTTSSLKRLLASAKSTSPFTATRMSWSRGPYPSLARDLFFILYPILNLESPFATS